MPPVTGNREASLDGLAGVTDVADFLEEEEMERAGAARTIEKGMVVVAVSIVNRTNSLLWR